jgi:hypothetical protein
MKKQSDNWPIGLVEAVWALKRKFEKKTGKKVFWTFTLGDLDGRICTLVTLGVGGKKIEIKVEKKLSFAMKEIKSLFNKTFPRTPKVAV